MLLYFHVSHVLLGLGELKLGKTLAESAENAEKLGKLKLGFIISQIALFNIEKHERNKNAS